MTNSIKELRRKRLQFLFHLYETTKGQPRVSANMWELGDELGFSKDETGRIVDYLSKEYLLKHVFLGGGISIEHAGVVKVENSYAELEDMRKRIPQQQKAIQKHETKGTRVSHQAATVKILFLAANPTDTSRLRLDEESRAIDQVLRQAEFRDRFNVEQHWAVRVTDIQGYLLRHKPDIVHFSGHGGQSSEIIMEDSSGESHPVSARALSTLFSVLKGNIRCVVLNACYSERQAKAIAEHIDCVIGMSKSIKDVSAVNFATAFYQALAYGQDVRAAFDLGCIQIDLENPSEQDRPKLIALGKNPREILFVNQSEILISNQTLGNSRIIQETAGKLTRTLQNFRYTNPKEIEVAAGVPVQRAYTQLRANYDDWVIAVSPYLEPNERDEIREIGEKQLGIKSLASQIMSVRKKIIEYTNLVLDDYV